AATRSSPTAAPVIPKACLLSILVSTRPSVASARCCACTPSLGTALPTRIVPNPPAARAPGIDWPCFAAGPGPPGAAVPPSAPRLVRPRPGNIAPATRPEDVQGIPRLTTNSVLPTLNPINRIKPEPAAHSQRGVRFPKPHGE